jgi:pimeloyl-ACP methyl ester carboxylesterase
MRGEFIDLGGERLYYYAAGTRGSGDPIVLLHGFPTSSHLWLDVVAKLPEGHRVIVVDLLGYGRSDGPLSARYTVDAHANRVVALLDQLKVDRCCLVGHGTGGAIAARAALEQSSHFSSLALIGSSTSEGWFAKPHSTRTLYDLALRMPSAVWMPILRGKIAGSYSDPARGLKSAEMYLARFLDGEGPRLLRRHIIELTNGEIADVAARLSGLTIPVVASPRSPWRFMPEESPSEAAAIIRAALKP